MVIEPQDDREIEIGECTARFDQIGGLHIDGLHIDVPEGRERLSISPDKFEEIAREAGYVPADEVGE